MHSIGLTLLIVHKCAAQWHQVHSHCCAAMRPSVHLQNFFILPNGSAVPVNTAPRSPSPAPGNCSSLLCLSELGYSRGVLQCVSFCDCLIALSRVPPRSPHNVAQNSLPSRGRKGWPATHPTGMARFVYPSIPPWTLRLLLPVIVMSSVAMNVGTQVLIWTCAS